MKAKIVMIGPSLNGQGGISTVKNMIIKNFPNYIECYMIETLSGNNLILNLYTFLKSILRLNILVLTKKINIYHIHFASRGSTLRKLIIASILILYKQKFIIHAHGAEFHIFYNNLPKIFKNIISFIFNKCKYLIVLSNSWKDFYSNAFNIENEKIKVIPNPVIINKNLKMDFNNQDLIKFVFLGRIGKRKGIFDLIKAFSKLPSDIKNKVLLDIAGDGEVDEAQKLIRELKLNNYINVYSWLSYKEKDLLLKKANCFILPSYNEGLPMALLEALAYGLAVITTPVGGIPELIKDGENGILVKPGDIDMIASAIERIVRDKNLRVKIGINGFNTAMKYDIKLYINKLIKLYIGEDD
ncbi:glycosyltransferase family 4 protein [Carboxydocella sp. ULO1]|uniref:glycosyltransferase family 4 protein n=1 Tax=Carboxydocella sp. ULO1 TaxID=1926599 RepID=UPI0013563947|nr:glycosyltransferase family 4 protein [Carboxydocella sp. ULO1]